MANDSDSDKIEEVLMKAISNLEDFEEDDMLVDWVVVAYTQNPNDMGETDSYPMLYSNGTMATYKVRGLLTTALKLINQDNPD